MKTKKNYFFDDAARRKAAQKEINRTVLTYVVVHVGVFVLSAVAAHVIAKKLNSAS